VSSGSALLFAKRFEDEKGTNPRSSSPPRHASCFTMALSGELGKAGMTAESLRTTCTVTFEKVGDKPTVTASHLELVAKIPGASSDAFLNAAHAAETGCPISRLLNTKITLDAKLEG
jgi:osmotically inducible protein OsmC